MKRGIITESQIVIAFKEWGADRNASGIFRGLRFYKTAFYNWKKKYSGYGRLRHKALEETGGEIQGL